MLTPSSSYSRSAGASVTTTRPAARTASAAAPGAVTSASPSCTPWRDRARRNASFRGAGHLAVERAVRLHVREPHALRRRDRLQRTGLVEDVVDGVVLRHREASPTEPQEVGVARVRPDGHAGVPGEDNGRPHVGGVARVEAARDVDGRDELQELGVRPEDPAAEALSCVRVDVDVGHGLGLPRVVVRVVGRRHGATGEVVDSARSRASTYRSTCSRRNVMGGLIFRTLSRLPVG